MLGLAVELKRRGAEVYFATNGHYRRVVEEYGIPFEAMGDEAAFQACVRHPHLWKPRHAMGHILSFLKPFMEPHYAWHVRHAAEAKVVAITNCFGFGALMAQDSHGLPVFTLHLQPAVLWSDHEPPQLANLRGPKWLRRLMFRLGERWIVDGTVLPLVNPWRARLGLAPIAKTMQWWNGKCGVVGMFPEWFAAPQPDWPQPLALTDFPLWSSGGERAIPSEVVDFLEGGEAPIVFTPGTGNYQAVPFFRAAVEACERLGRRGILLSEFEDQIPRPLPRAILYAPYVPLEQLLSKAAAFVHHGGIGSTSQGMAAGVPQLLMPMAHDQFDNANRVRKLGIGTWLSVGAFRGARVAKELDRLLGSAQVRQCVREVASRFVLTENGRSRGITRTADWIEQRLSE